MLNAFSADAGIVVTASHNPIEYNGIKFVKQGSQPLSDLEFDNIRRLAEENIFVSSFHSGLVTDKRVEGRNAYTNKVLSFVNLQSLKPLKIVINSGNGAAGPTIDALQIN